jgi:hypothetical protein
MNEIITQEVKTELETRNTSLTERVLSLVVSDDKINNEATTLLKSVKEMRTRIEDTFRPAVSDAKKAYDSARGLRDTFLKPVESAEAALRGKISAYVQAENARLEAIAAAEAKKRESEIRKAERKAEKTGQPIVLPTAPAAVAVKVAGTYMERWTAQVVDLKALCKAVANGTAPTEAIMPNMTFLNRQAISYKGNLQIAGVKPVKTTTAVVR